MYLKIPRSLCGTSRIRCGAFGSAALLLKPMDWRTAQFKVPGSSWRGPTRPHGAPASRVERTPLPKLCRRLHCAAKSFVSVLLGTGTLSDGHPRTLLGVDVAPGIGSLYTDSACARTNRFDRYCSFRQGFKRGSEKGAINRECALPRCLWWWLGVKHCSTVQQCAGGRDHGSRTWVIFLRESGSRPCTPRG